MQISIPGSQSLPNLSYKLPDEFRSDCGKLIKEIGTFLSEDRIAKMQEVVKKRSRQVLTIFENTHHAHNISAVLRNVDTFGFLDLIFLYSNPQMRFRAFDSIDRGASQWLFPKRLSSIEKTAKILKHNNYKIALVSLPHFSRTSQNYKAQIPSFSSHEFFSDAFHEIVQDNKIGLVFGSELMGVSEEWNEYADIYVHVNMFGFTESLNVSVCAGIILHSLRECFEKRHKKITLNEIEETLVFEHWIAKDFANAEQYLSNRKPELLQWFDYIRKGRFFTINND